MILFPFSIRCGGCSDLTDDARVKHLQDKSGPNRGRLYNRSPPWRIDPHNMETLAEAVTRNSPEADSNIADIERVLHFAVAGTDFCFPLQHVIRIFPIVQFRYVPGGPSCLRGLMTIEGKSLPVIDLAVRLEMPDPHRYHLETPILLCKSYEKTVGLIVDEIFGVEEVEAGQVQMRPLFKKGDTMPLEATIKTKRGHLLLLDIHRVLGIDLTTVFKEMQDDRRKNTNSPG